MFKKVVAFCSAIALSIACVLPLACVGADQHEHDGHHGGGGKSRFVPYAPFNDILNNINQEIPLSDFWHGVQVIHSSAMDTIPDVTTEVLQTWDKFKNYLADYMYSNVAGQRVIDLVDYANGSTSGLTTGGKVYSFIAKRSLTLSYDETNQPDLVETDTMYFWKDLNHTINNDFSGVQIGDFYMMPNTIFVTREFSNGDMRCFYADASQFRVDADNSNVLQLRFNPGSILTCVSSDGSLDSITIPDTYSSNNCRIYFDTLKSGNLNSIDSGSDLAYQSLYYSRYGDFVSNGIPSDIMCLVGNEEYNSALLFPNNSRGGNGFSVQTWYMSSGGFIGTNFNNYFNSDPNTIDPKKPPSYVNNDTRLQPNASLTVNNVSNYNDFGVTYNDVTGKFDLDLNALAAGLAANIVPQFQAVFDGTYSAQPDIDSNDWSVSNLTNNYIDDYSDLVVDISNEVQEILDSRSPVWVPPRYPAVNTSVYIPAQTPTYSTYAAATVPAGVISSASTFMHMGFDLFEDLGLLVIIIPCAILAILWKFTGG